jgi:hypothetical protein
MSCYKFAVKENGTKKINENKKTISQDKWMIATMRSIQQK